jgi:dTDP-4-amino-4,6-dideoxygalactose transaminase
MMLNTPFPPWPSFTAEEADAVRAVLLSNRVNYWTGEEGRKFEAEFAVWTETAHAIALSNGTVALELALLGLGIQAGDEVVVTPRSFMASASCVVTVGATPVFAEVDRETGNLTAESIEAVLTPRTRAVIAVHLAGWPCDIDPIMELAQRHNLWVIEDCAQAHGARYKGRSVGSIGHVGAWSFCQDKIMTTGGEGGMLTTSDPDLWRRMWSLKDHGKSWEAVYERQHPPGFRWVHEGIGTNGRMTEMQAAIGRIQLGRMESWTRARTVNAHALTEAFRPFAAGDGPIRLPAYGCSGCAEGLAGCAELQRSGCRHAWYKYYVYVRPDHLALGWTRDRIMEEVNARGVPCYQGSCSEIYLEVAWADRNLRPKGRLPVARELGETSLMFLVHPTLRPENLARTSDAISEVLEQAALRQPE